MIQRFRSSIHDFDIFITLSLALFFTLLISLSVFIPKGEDVLWANGHNTPFQDWFFSLVTFMGDGIIFIPLILFLLFVRFYYSIALILVGLLNGLLIPLCKFILFSDMSRPIAYLDNSVLHFVKGVNVHSLYSFPSGHTATAFAAAISISLCLRNKTLSLLLITVASLVGYSRIYLLQHFLIDVSAGAFIGTISSFLVTRYLPFDRISWMNHRLQIRFQIKSQDIQTTGR